MITDETELRREIVAAARRMNTLGINQGTSGNLSVRIGDAMLITPSAVAYDAMQPEQIARMSLEDADGSWQGPLRPSSEWRLHREILRARRETGAVVHCHATFATVLAIARREIPPVHYMIGVFGGANVRCAPYALFGSQALAENARAALDGREACLLANHGMVALGDTLDRAMWRAVELEALAKQYYYSLLIGGGVPLTETEIAETLANIATYGVRDRSAD